MVSTKKTGSGFSGALPSPKASKLTIAEVKDLTEHLKKLLDDSHLKWWIIGAGLGGFIETARLG